MSDTTDALDSLLEHPGWQLFAQHVRTEWGATGYGKRVKQALAHAKQVHADAAAAVEQVDYANDRIGELLGWPQAECARLTRLEQDPKPDALAVMSRRGSL